MPEPLDLEPIREHLASAYRDGDPWNETDRLGPDVEALIAEVERLREALARLAADYC